jgi:cytochrome P450
MGIKTTRFTEFSLRRSAFGCELEIRGVDTARTLFAKHTQRRFRSLVALVRSGVHHCVMIVADGQEWKRTHEAIIPHLQPACVARHQAAVVQAVADEAFGQIAARSFGAGSAPVPVVIEVEPLMRRVTVSVMAHLLFGRALDLAQADELQRTLSESMRELPPGLLGGINRMIGMGLRLLNVPQWQRVVLPRAQRHALRELLDWIENQMQVPPGANVDQPLLESLRARFAELKPRQQQRRIAAECAMLLMAGIETTAAALTFALAEIANSDAVRDDVTAEARGAEGHASVDALTQNYPCIYRVLRETLRKHAVVPTMLREAANDFEIRGRRPGASEEETVRIKRGTVLRYFPVHGNLQREIWTDPQCFDPDRFGGPLSAEQRKHHHTFGLGPQSCPGRSLATMEFILILRAFLRKLDLEVTPLAQPIAVRRTALLTIRPMGVRVTVRGASGAPSTARSAVVP